MNPDGITHPLNPNGGLQNRNNRLLCTVEARRALSDKWHRLSRESPGQVEIDCLRRMGYSACLAAIIVSQRYNRLDLAITHLREHLTAYGEQMMKRTRQAMAEFARTHTINDLAPEIKVLLCEMEL
jgi:hypothetical protein